MVLGKLLVPDVLLILIIVGKGPTALAVGAGGGVLSSITSLFFLSTIAPPDQPRSSSVRYNVALLHVPSVRYNVALLHVVYT